MPETSQDTETGLDIGHEADWECSVCGGPEAAATSQQGCRYCKSQDDIVPRGTVARRWQAIQLQYPDSPEVIESLHSLLDWRNPAVELNFIHLLQFRH